MSGSGRVLLRLGKESCCWTRASGRRNLLLALVQLLLGGRRHTDIISLAH